MTNRYERRATRRGKQTHKIEPQRCVLWIPEARGFLAGFSRDRFTVTDSPSLAMQFCEHLAPSAALSVRDLFGMRAAVRPVYDDGEPVVTLTPRGETLAAQLA
jgi:hypothetical protein